MGKAISVFLMIVAANVVGEIAARSLYNRSATLRRIVGPY